MNSDFEEIYNLSEIFDNHQLNLSKCSCFNPWIVGLVCLKAVEYSQNSDKNLVLPENEKYISYLKKIQINNILNELSYKSFLKSFNVEDIEEDINIQKILHCDFRDEFEAHLLSKIRMMFRDFGLNTDDEYRATTLLGELGNNVFDHNVGSWSMNFKGAIIISQNYPESKKIEVVVADSGVGFKESLKLRDPNIKNDIEAIKLGLSGITGRVGEDRGNGLKLIQDWTINKFSGIVKIHSGKGLVIVDKEGKKEKEVFNILGTIASFIINY